jgi:methyltransferase (TIGR00027 family)
MQEKKTVPDHTAVRAALWRALHVLIDSSPHVLEDTIGLKLAAPEEGWQERPDMHPKGTAPFRASIVARARFIEDLIEAEFKKGIKQYVILGAGLDTFAQRRAELASQMQIFEVDQRETQAWKKERLQELNLPAKLHFVPVNFEKKPSLWSELAKAGFEKTKPAIVSSLGVSMYLSLASIMETLREMATMASASTFIMTFMLPLEKVDAEDRLGYERSMKGAAASGTPFISFFTPDEVKKLALECGFKTIEIVSTSSLSYFNGRADGLRASTGEELLIART